MTWWNRLRAHMRSDEGIALPAVIGVMIIVSAMVAALLTSVQADTGLSRRDQDRKAAYAAAEAGINNYLFRLTDDPEVWTNCTAIGGTQFVSQQWNGSGTDTRSWRSLPGSEAQYTVELLPNSTHTTCDGTTPSTAANSLLDQGTINIRATGRMRGRKRSIVARLRRHTFLDYIYFTNYETMDPVWYTRYSTGAATTPDLVAWANANCRYYRDGRASQTYHGTYNNGNNDIDMGCVEINFVEDDTITGPFHTNDSILTCGSPSFGGGASTQIELNPPAPGWRANTNNGCNGATPDFNGQVTSTPNVLPMPPTNASLLNDTLPAYVYTGTKHITLGATTYNIKDDATGITTSNVAYPSNGLIYVKNGSCGEGYKAYDPLNQTNGCANVFVHGTNGTSLTIASQKDIIVDGNISNSSDALLGLIANEFVRVQHVIQNVNGNNCDNANPVLNNLTINAAILSLAHSFAVDSYFCGNTMGTLTVNGAIGQNYRGAVGTIGNSGYLKNYVYDPRLSYRSPPHFLDPVSASFRILNENEQVPAR
jgi:Tfp pilus assembly protein PilX